MRTSFRIEWCKNFQEHVTDLKITVENEHKFFLRMASLFKSSIKIVSMCSVRISTFQYKVMPK